MGFKDGGARPEIVQDASMHRATQAIRTKTLSVTATRPTRVLATGGKWRKYRVIISPTPEETIEQAHRRAAKQYCETLGWRGVWACGSLDTDEMAWVQVSMTWDGHLTNPHFDTRATVPKEMTKP